MIIKKNYLGHRKRIKDKFLKHGASYMEDRELLEMLLFMSIPRRDTKQDAKNIIEQFASLANFINASDEQFKDKKIPNNTIIIAKIVRESITRCLENEMKKGNIISNWQALINYCRQKYGHVNIEQFIVIFLNAKNHVIADIVMHTGTIDRTIVYPRDLAQKALNLCACSVVLVHNHPSGDTSASQEDIALTREIINTFNSVSIDVYDHVIISRNKDFFSFKRNGLL